MSSLCVYENGNDTGLRVLKLKQHRKQSRGRHALLPPVSITRHAELYLQPLSCFEFHYILSQSRFIQSYLSVIVHLLFSSCFGAT
jgi:hypothetical protein